MNTLRIVPVLSEEDVTRPTELPSFETAATELAPPRVWLRPVSNEETRIVGRHAGQKKDSLVLICILSLLIGGLAGCLGRAALPHAARFLHTTVQHEPRRAEDDAPASLVSHAASTKADIKPAAPVPPPISPKKKPTPKVSDLEIETSFRMDS